MSQATVPSRWVSLPLFAALGAVLGAAAAVCAPSLARGQEGPEPVPIEVVADAVLIDAHCRNVAVDMGALFRYAQDHGIEPSAILPLGGERKAFEGLLARRAEGIAGEDGCAAAAAHEKDLAPGVVRSP